MKKAKTRGTLSNLSRLCCFAAPVPVVGIGATFFPNANRRYPAVFMLLSPFSRRRLMRSVSIIFFLPQHRGFDTNTSLHPHPINEGVKGGEARKGGEIPMRKAPPPWMRRSVDTINSKLSDRLPFLFGKACYVFRSENALYGTGHIIGRMMIMKTALLLNTL